ncbi:hypothetical protein Ancab_002191 [Ancistrocladus abbreviatus]
MHRIPSELRSKACLGESSTRMGDLLASPRVAPHNFLFRPHGEAFRAVPQPRRFDPLFHPEMPSSAPNFTCVFPSDGFAKFKLLTSFFFPLPFLHSPKYLRGGKCALTSQRARRVGNEAGRMGNGRDHTGTDGPDPTQNPTAKDVWPRVAPGWVTLRKAHLSDPLIIIPRPPERLFARAAEAGRRVKNDVKGRRSGCDHTSTNAPDPIRTPQQSVFGRDPRVAPHNFLFRPRGAAFPAVPCRRGGFTLYFAPKCPLVPPISPATSKAENVHLHLNAGGGSGTKWEGWEMGAITPALTARIPPEPRGQGCLAESSTGMGDPEESALVGPLIIIPRPPERLFARAAEAREEG